MEPNRLSVMANEAENLAERSGKETSMAPVKTKLLSSRVVAYTPRAEPTENATEGFPLRGK